jgi:hypothetical protein
MSSAALEKTASIAFSRSSPFRSLVRDLAEVELEGVDHRRGAVDADHLGGRDDAVAQRSDQQPDLVGEAVVEPAGLGG